MTYKGTIVAAALLVAAPSHACEPFAQLSVLCENNVRVRGVHLEPLHKGISVDLPAEIFDALFPRVPNYGTFPDVGTLYRLRVGDGTWVLVQARRGEALGWEQ